MRSLILFKDGGWIWIGKIEIIYQLNATMNLHWLLPYLNPFEYLSQKNNWIEQCEINPSIIPWNTGWFIGIALFHYCNPQYID